MDDVTGRIGPILQRLQKVMHLTMLQGSNMVSYMVCPCRWGGCALALESDLTDNISCSSTSLGSTPHLDIFLPTFNIAASNLSAALEGVTAT